ncbi:hypothetical protein HNO92_004479 [Chromobacterium alkanivorans]|uniref:hypothetical protein n=1 Tax=Chromobacterium alkanivorans TaxID=1071719 RepID=UPI002168A3EA|nr:hypothetical protein [Chromobacterium alkanivorans]MCS3804055.1 hypothetical protein [Chromobacterium alkanivorans]MCS3818724.1 hypothetical protein [Chromobacterium alkanivorans]MCS3876130.1 hypothetical protein [Chromobacterium alkanivorans]
MTPPNSFAACAKSSPAVSQEQQYLLSQTMDACALALNGFAVLRSTLTAIQASGRRDDSSHLQLLARLSLEALDDCVARLQAFQLKADDDFKTIRRG